MAKQFGSEKILPYNDQEHKGAQIERMFDSMRALTTN